jgi:oxygen-dependent protoporphyrinogen oxidase
LGQEARQKFIGPVLAGIYNTNPETQSILTTSPIMREMEAEYGGLFKGAFGRMRAARKAKKNGPSARDDAPSKPRFITFQNGAEEIIAQMIEKITGDLRLNAWATKIEQNSDRYLVYLKDGSTIAAEAVILATTANVTAKLLADSTPDVAKMLERIRHTNIGTISLAYDHAQITDFPFRGLMIPRREKRNIDAVTYTSAKLAIRAPQGCSLVRVFFGAGNPDTVLINDEKLLATVRQELAALLDIHADPIGYRVCRWPEEFPQADVGHLDLVAEIEAALPDGLFVAGSSYRGIGVPDCVRQGREAAQKVIERG